MSLACPFAPSLRSSPLLALLPHPYLISMNQTMPPSASVPFIWPHPLSYFLWVPGLVSTLHPWSSGGNGSLLLPVAGNLTVAWWGPVLAHSSARSPFIRPSSVTPFEWAIDFLLRPWLTQINYFEKEEWEMDGYSSRYQAMLFQQCVLNGETSNISAEGIRGLAGVRLGFCWKWQFK